MKDWSTHRVKDEGVRAGEIIAYRGWVYGQGFPLRSVAMGSLWRAPGGKMQGDVRYHGVYSFKTPELAQTGMYEWTYSGHKKCIILGSIVIWGKVVEHVDGYRSEFAKMRSFDAVLRYGNALAYRADPLLEGARRFYGLVEPVVAAPVEVNSSDWTGR